MSKEIIENIPIIDLPELPPEIIEAANQRKLVVFIGAGISRLMGCQSWENMANNLIMNLFDYGTADQIISSKMDSKAKITIAKRFAYQDEEKKEIFWDEFKRAITPQYTQNNRGDGSNNDNNKNDIYDLISQLKTIYVTTNCDGLLISKGFSHSFTTNCTVEEYEKHKLKSYVFCIHGNLGTGSEAEKNSLIFTVDEYLAAYQPQNPLPNFLRTIMGDDNVVLFLGYGMSEFEILSTAFVPSNSNNKGKHFLLDGFFRYQQELCNAYGTYYRTLGINLIAYSKDKNGHKQQYNIIEEWIKELRGKTSYNSRGVQILVNALDEFNEENQEEVLRGLSRNDDLKYSYFIAVADCLPKTPACYKWIKYLFDNHFITSEINIENINKDLGNHNTNLNTLYAISNCLKNYSPNDEERIFLTTFIRECVLFSSKMEYEIIDIRTISKLLEVYLKLGMIPENDYEWIVWERWAEKNDYNIIVIEQCEKELFSWPDVDVERLLFRLYSIGDTQEQRLYLFDKLTDIVIRRATKSTRTKLLKILVRYLYQVEDNNVLSYNSIEDRYHNQIYGYSAALIKSAKYILDSLDNDNKIDFIKYLFQEANNSYSYQLALYYTRLAQIDNSLIFISNPLNQKNSFVDFYYLLDETTKKNYKYDKKLIESIADWIVNASFGIDLNSIEDAEWAETCKKKINTWKYQLYKLIVILDDSLIYLLKTITIEERFESPTPSEDKESYYSIRFFSPISDEIISDINLDGVVGEDLLRVVDEAFNKTSFKDYYTRTDICKSVIEKITDEQLETFIIAAFSWGDEELSAFTYCISDSSVIGRCDKETIKRTIDLLRNRIYSEKENSEVRYRLVRHFVYVLQKLNEAGWSQMQVLQILLSLITDKLFLVPEEYHEDMDIIMNLINVAESELYILTIDTATYCKSEEKIVKQYQEWFEKNIIERNNCWRDYACALRIQNLYYVDKEWTDRTIMPVLIQSQRKKEIAFCMCCGSQVILQEIIDYIVQDNNIEKICGWIGEKDVNNRNAESFINYMVVARYYDKLLELNYWRFIDSLANDNVDHLVWSILLGIKDANFSSILQLLNNTYNRYKITHDSAAFSKAVAIFSSRFDEVNEELWNFIAETISNSASETRIWVIINDCIKHSKKANDSISKVVEVLCDKSTAPYEYVLNEIMYNLAKINALDLVKHLARYAIDKGINPSGNALYYDNPEKVLEDYKQYG